MIQRSIQYCLAALCVCCAAHVAAHPFSISEADATITSLGVTVEMRIMPEDFFLYYDLSLDDEDRLSKADIEQSARKHRDFLRERFSIHDDRGQRLDGKIDIKRQFEIPDEGVPMADLMSYHTIYEARYSFQRLPKLLTFRQNFSGSAAAMQSSMFLLAEHKGRRARTATLTPSSWFVFELDWAAPVGDLSDASLEALRQRTEKARQERLGITNYSAIYSFIYIEPREIRHEILAPLATLSEWMDVERADPETVTVAEQDALIDEITRSFTRRNRVRVGDREIDFEARRIDFYGRNFPDFAKRPPRADLALREARVGVILAAPTEAPAERVKFECRMFNRHVSEIRSVVVGGEEARPHTFRRNRDSMIWTAPEGFGKPRLFDVPANGVPSDARATREVVARLLPNIYNSFEFGAEEAVYDALARSVEGPLLARLYTQIRKSLEMREQGGAVSRVNDLVVTVVDKSDSGDDWFECEAHWLVAGTVEHWGHLHERKNAYRAGLELKIIDGQWKITGLNMLDQQRVSYRVNVRKF